MLAEQRSSVSKVFYKLGRMAGPSVRKAKWQWQSTTNSQAEAIKAEYEVGKDMAHDVQHRLVLDHDLQIVRIISEVGSHLASHASKGPQAAKNCGWEPSAD